MKRINHSAGALALILGAALCTFTPGMAAQSGDKAQQPGQQQPGQQQQAQQENKTSRARFRNFQVDSMPW